MEGYKLMFNDTIVTVWSAPNYCYRCGNVAAILEFDEHLNKNFKIFDAAPQVQSFNLGCKRNAGQESSARLLFIKIVIDISLFVSRHDHDQIWLQRINKEYFFIKFSQI
jgi:hypothetical protein